MPVHPQIVSVDETGSGIKRIRPKSLYDMLKVCRCVCVRVFWGVPCSGCARNRTNRVLGGAVLRSSGSAAGDDGPMRQSSSALDRLSTRPRQPPALAWARPPHPALPWCRRCPQAAGHCIPEDEEHEALPPTSSQPMPAVGRRTMLSRP